MARTFADRIDIRWSPFGMSLAFTDVESTEEPVVVAITPELAAVMRDLLAEQLTAFESTCGPVRVPPTPKEQP